MLLGCSNSDSASGKNGQGGNEGGGNEQSGGNEGGGNEGGGNEGGGNEQNGSNEGGGNSQGNEENDPIAHPNCHNGALDPGEACDGTLFNDKIIVNCSSGLTFDSSKLACTDTCALDMRDACVDLRCGNKRLNGEEQCDGKSFRREAVDALRCGGGLKIDEELLTCTDSCTIDMSQACVTDYSVLFSEVVPALENDSFNALALELSYLNEGNLSVGSCDLFMSNAEGTDQHVWKLEDIGISSISGDKPTVVCLQPDGYDGFGGACDKNIVVNDVLDIVSDAAILAMRCDGNYIDIFNMVSFRAAVNSRGVDFIRHCNAAPITEIENALLGESWTIDPANDSAPRYGLGSHCSAADLKVSSCTYTADRTTLTSRDQSVALTLDVKIPGLTDLTSRLDSKPDLKIYFYTGKLNEGTVSHTIHHMPAVQPDIQWTNKDGLDRYTGVLRNWDDYEGFMDYEAGTYVLDAGISFDNGITWTYCGPKGIIKNIASYNADERNTLTVAYEENRCGDGFITADEVCEGSTYLDALLTCPDGKVADATKAKCFSCTMTNLADVDICVSIPPNCKDGKRDDDEICDGNQFDHETIGAHCGSNKTYVPSRVRCNDICSAVEEATCVSKNYNIVMDEYLASKDPDGTRSMALAFRNQMSKDIPYTACSLYFYDSSRNILTYYGLNEIVRDNEGAISCEPLVICSEAVWNNSTHTQVFEKGLCDVTFAMPSGPTGMETLLDSEEVAYIQLSCGGELIDTINVSSIRTKLEEGYTHGKLKASDHMAWPNIASVNLMERMDLDKTFNQSAFAPNNAECD